MIVRYFAYYRNDTGLKEEKLLLEPLTALELLGKLSERYGETMRKQWLSPDGKDIHPDVIFLIDGRNIDFVDGKNSLVQKDAVVSLFPRIAGG
ncbi:MAG: MoaD/ThiS family protein [Anaerovoracaceae bacterium]|jgi:molybdopterin converting factor small subunit